MGNCCLRASESSQSYVVVKLVNYDKSSTNVVMSLEKLQALKKTIADESPLFAKALASAAVEWRKDENFGRQMFPSAVLGMRQITAGSQTYPSEQKAQDALNALQASASRIKSKRQPSKFEIEKAERITQAVELLVEQLENLKNPDQPGDSTVSTNKLILTAGEVLDRTTEGETHIGYHVAVPGSYDVAKLPPLLVVFSPGGDGKGMMNHVKASANEVGWMVIGCDKLKNNMTEAEQTPMEKDLMNDIRKFIPYDVNRLYYGGMSGGAWRAYRMTCRFKDKCAGVLAFGGWLGGAEDQKKPYQRKMSIAMLNGNDDKGASCWEEQDKAALERRKCKVKIFKFPGGHVMAPKEVIDKAVAWMEEQAGINNQKTK